MTTWTRYQREGTTVWHDGAARMIRRSHAGGYYLVDLAYEPIPADWKVRTFAEARALAATNPAPKWDHQTRISADDPRVLDALRGWRIIGDAEAAQVTA